MPGPLARIQPDRTLVPIDLVAPGFRGLNLSQAGSVLSPAYATEAQNGVIDAEGRLAARKGFTTLTPTAISGTPTVRELFEYRTSLGSVLPIVAWDGGIGASLQDPSGADISGSLVDSNGNWWFQNFNNKCLAFQAGQKLAVYTGSGTFATVAETAGSAPTGGVATAAFGRVWQVDADGVTIKYSALLDETAWSEELGGGVIDMTNIWTQGTDTVTAIVGYNGALIVFGQRHIAFFIDGRGSALGLDPTQIYLSDIIGGVGCISQRTVQAVGETDLLFLSDVGLQSLKRLQNERSSPINNLSKYVRDALISQLSLENPEDIRSTYNDLHGFYLLSLPASGVTWVFDQRKRYRDQDNDECAIVTQWTVAPTALLTRANKQLVASLAGGTTARYLGDSDGGTAFTFKYESPWLDLGEDFANKLKLLKRLGSIFFVRAGATVLFKWATDFASVFQSISRTMPGTPVASEWGTGEWGLAEWGGPLSLQIIKVPARDRGQYYRIGLEVNVSGDFAVQQTELFTKIGRLA